MSAHESESTVELAGGTSPELAPPPLQPLVAEVPTSVWTAIWVILAFGVLSAGVLAG